MTTLPPHGQIVSNLNVDGQIAFSISYVGEDDEVVRYDADHNLVTPAPGQVFPIAPTNVNIILYADGSVKLYESQNANGDHILLNFEDAGPQDLNTYQFGPADAFRTGALTHSTITSGDGHYEIQQDFTNGVLTHYSLVSTDSGHPLTLTAVADPSQAGGADAPKLLVTLTNDAHSGQDALTAFADSGNFDPLRLISSDAASIISNDGASIISNDGASIISNDGASIISNDGASIISNDGGSLISNDGASLLPIGELIGKVGASIISNDGASLIGNDGAGLIGPNGGTFVNGELQGTALTAGTFSTDFLANFSTLAGQNISLYQAPADDAADTDGRSTAAALDLGTVSDTLADNGDGHWYKISLTAGTTYVFDLKGESSGGGTLSDPYLKLFDAGGVLIKEVDDGGVGYDAKLVYTPATDGTFYVMARAYNDAGHGTYQLDFSTGSAAPEILTNGGGDSATIDVPENVDGGGSDTVTIVSGWDLIDGNTLKYSMSGEDAAQFDLNPFNGYLSFHATPDFETPRDANHDNIYHVTVTAADSEGNTDSQDLTIRVTNIVEPISGTDGADLIDATHAGATGGSPTDNDDKVLGLGGNDTLFGLGGDDVLVGGAGSNSLVGGDGDDSAVFSGNMADYTITRDALSDIVKVTGAGGTDILVGVEHAVFDDGSATLEIKGTNGDDNLAGTDGDDIVAPLLGHDLVDGKGGTDRLVVDYSSLAAHVVFETQGAGNASLFYVAAGNNGDFGLDFVEYSNIEAFTVRGSLTESNTLAGGGGDDVLFGGVAGDSLVGGAGDDVIGVYGGATANDTGAASVDLGAGGDDLLIADYSASTQSVTFKNAGYASTDSDGLHGDYLSDRSYGATYNAGDARLQFSGVERFDITGGSAGDVLTGGDGADELTGNDGDDTLDSGKGHAVIDGGEGVDLWKADLSLLTSGVFLDFSDPSVSQSLPDGSTIVGIERLGLVGTGLNDIIKLDADFAAYGNTLSLGGGNDTATIFGGSDANASGVNSVDLGEGGDDLLIADYSASTQSITFKNAGFASTDSDGLHGDYLSDRAYGATYNAGDSRLQFGGVERFNVTGGSAGDVLIGGDWADVLKGNDGDDTLDSGKGKATIDGGVGVDLWKADLSLLTSGASLDFSNPLLAQSLADGSSIVGIERVNLIGTGLGDTVALDTDFSRYDNSMSLGAGNDKTTIFGGSDANASGVNSIDMGADGDDLLIADYSASTQSVTFKNAGFASTDGDGLHGDYLSDRTYGATYNAGDGRLQFSGVERFDVTGGSADDVLIGGDWADALKGSGGDDTLDSGKGKATIEGGSGVDLWKADLSLLTSGATLDFSNPSVARGLADGSSIVGIERVDLIGTELGDTVTLDTDFSRYDNSMSLGAGNDTAAVFGGSDASSAGANSIDMGAGGDDLLIADYSASTQSVTFKNAGFASTDGNGLHGDYLSDRTYGATYNAGDGRLQFSGVERFDVTGGSANDNLSGGDWADVLKGGDGDDTLKGNGGDDALDSGRGVATVDGGDGIDLWQADLSMLTIAASLDFSDPSVSQSLADGSSIAGIERVDLAGTELGDTINLDAAASGYGNSLALGDGNDTVTVFGGPTAALSGRNAADLGAGGNDLLIADYSAATQAIVFAIAGHAANKKGAEADYFSNGDHGVTYNGSGRLNFSGVERFDITGGSANDKLNTGDWADTVAGGDGNDTIHGNAGNDTLYGDGTAKARTDGKDILVGGAGRDQLWGGGGADSFVFDDKDTALKAKGRDEIHDFVHREHDLIDLSLIDANDKTGRDDTFKIYATEKQALAHVGALFIDGHNGDITLYMNNDAKKGFEVAIDLDHVKTLAQGDFLL